MNHHQSSLLLLLLSLLLLNTSASLIDQESNTATTTTTTAAAKPKVVNIVLIGSTGNLSKKYLWQSLFDIWYESNNNNENNSSNNNNNNNNNNSTAYNKIHVFPAGSANATERLQSVLNSNISACFEAAQEAERKKKQARYMYPYEYAHVNVKQQTCSSFLSCVDGYQQLRTIDDYQRLSLHIDALMQQNQWQEVGRLYYLAIPPQFYSSIASYINQVGRPLASSSTTTNAWLRVIFEKPFGSDLSSAEALAQQLSSSLHESEIYRIDHYLGKASVVAIEQFRRINQHSYGSLWNSQYIEHIEVVMTETDSCEGRTEFYDKYGVIRDVLQNHLTEILLRTLAPLAEQTDQAEQDITSAATSANRLHLLQHISKPRKQDAVLGQYATYSQHVKQDRAMKSDKPNTNDSGNSRTATSALVKLTVNEKQWEHTTIVLGSGKMLDTREAYVRIHIDLPNSDEFGVLEFHIQDSKHSAYISASPTLPAFQAPPGWTQVHPRLARLTHQPPAYEVLLKAALLGQRDMFVDTATLLASWQLWTPLLEEIEQSSHTPLLYVRGHHLTIPSEYFPKHKTAVDSLSMHDDL